MQASELIARLSELPPGTEVMVLDGSNGGGVPREINLGPVEHIISGADGKASADCEFLVGTTVCVIGYGCY